MTFIEYCCERLMGPPLRHTGSRSIWPCPECDDRTAFGTLPHKPEYKDRARCHRCGFRGDEADLIRFFNPREGWTQRRAKLADWFAAWNAGHVPEPVGIFHRGLESTEPSHVCVSCKMRDSDYDPAKDEFEPEADAAIKDLLAYLKNPPSHRALMELLQLCKKTLRICAEHGLHPLALAGRCAGEVWFRKSDAKHMTECDDPDCDYRCCRLTRGWTEEEIAADIEAGKKERAEAKQRKAERVRHACRNVRSGGNGRAA